tara:strand:+ start:556 stop:1320 length:765 start_codon:yes stop_codon:yes gene_type:complete
VLSGIKSPLRYPNDNSKIAHIVMKLIPSNTSAITSPFFSGAGLETALINQGLKIYGHSSFKSLYEFWSCLIENPEMVYQAAKHFYPIDEDIFYLIQERIHQNENPYVRAGIFFVINRCTVEGTVTHGSMMKRHPKFNEYSLLMLKNFKTNLLKVFYDESHEDVIDKSNKLILCCPPKYSSTVALNVNDTFFPENQKIDHKKLSERLFQKNKWILFSNYHKDLIEIYEPHNMIYIDKFYKETVDKPQYILITNGV